MTISNFQFAKKRDDGFRSGLEAKIASELGEELVTFEYEPHSICFLRPSRNSKYTPDFLLPNGIYIEAKGRFITSDRQKHLLMKLNKNPSHLKFFLALNHFFHQKLPL